MPSDTDEASTSTAGQKSATHECLVPFSARVFSALQCPSV